MKRILIIEDDKQFREFLQTILTKEGYHAEVVPDGKQGLVEMSTKKFDLIITDIFMPDLDGIGVLREMRKIHRNMKVICMSGGGRGISPSRCFNVC